MTAARFMRERGGGDAFADLTTEIDRALGDALRLEPLKAAFARPLLFFGDAGSGRTLSAMRTVRLAARDG